MKQDQAAKILEKLEAIELRLNAIEKTTENELQKVQNALDALTADQQDDVVDTLYRLDAKLTAILEAQKLNFEILKVFSADAIQH